LAPRCPCNLCVCLLLCRWSSWTCTSSERRPPTATAAAPPTSPPTVNAGRSPSDGRRWKIAVSELPLLLVLLLFLTRAPLRFSPMWRRSCHQPFAHVVPSTSFILYLFFTLSVSINELPSQQPRSTGIHNPSHFVQQFILRRGNSCWTSKCVWLGRRVCRLCFLTQRSALRAEDGFTPPRFGQMLGRVALFEEQVVCK